MTVSVWVVVAAGFAIGAAFWWLRGWFDRRAMRNGVEFAVTIGLTNATITHCAYHIRTTLGVVTAAQSLEDATRICQWWAEQLGLFDKEESR